MAFVSRQCHDAILQLSQAHSEMILPREPRCIKPELFRRWPQTFAGLTTKAVTATLRCRMNDVPQQDRPPGRTHHCVCLSLFRGYRRGWFVADLLAGLSVCLVMIPSVIAYAGLLGIPPQHGLYAALVPLLVYPLFGSSRQVIVGPDIAISLLVASVVAPLAGGDPGRAAVLAATVALLSGVLLLVGARVKLGAVADFLSKPVLVGYMTGAALILMSSQADKLFGIHL